MPFLLANLYSGFEFLIADDITTRSALPTFFSLCVYKTLAPSFFKLVNDFDF